MKYLAVLGLALLTSQQVFAKICPDKDVDQSPVQSTISPPGKDTPKPTVPKTTVPKPTEPKPTKPAPKIPSKFEWISTDILIEPDSPTTYSVKDPSVIYYNGHYHVFASIFDTGYNMVYLNFTDWSEASKAEFYHLDNSAIGEGYRAAPEVFYFEPQKLWYLVFQDGNAAYSTNPDISNPAGWSAIKHFYTDMPQIIKDHIGEYYWVDMYVVCDKKKCHLFSSDDNGQLYRSETPIEKFPEGMSEPVIALSEPDRFDLFEAALVYKMNDGDYILIVECIDGDTGFRYFRSWTSKAIEGPWKPLADTIENPFAGIANVKFSGTAWTSSISHGELVRHNVDQTLTIDICNMEFLYQGLDPKADDEYNKLPWRLAVLTPAKKIC